MDYEKEIYELKQTIANLQNEIKILKRTTSSNSITTDNLPIKTQCGNCNTKFSGYTCYCCKGCKGCSKNFDGRCNREVCKRCAKNEWRGMCPYCYLE